MSLSRLFLIFVLTLSWAQAQTNPMVEASLESSMVVVGEETFITLWTSGLTIIDWPDHPPRVAPLALKRDEKRRFQVNGYIREGFRYRLMAFEPGVYQIPPFSFRTSSGVVSSKPLVLRVFPISSLLTQGIKVSGMVTPCLTGVFLEKPSPYLGEIQNVEAKLYLSQAAPNRLSLADGKVIQMQKESLAAWRFTTTPKPTGSLEYDGQHFQVYTYQSSLSALTEGPLTLGPGQAEAVFYHRASPFLQAIKFPATPLQVRPLPPDAPAGFEGAVGQFEMNVRPLSREFELGDSLTVEIDINGTGNLNQISGPNLSDPDEQWKQFEMIAKPNGAERRSTSGTKEFSQLIRPKEKVEHLSPYRFVYFDPLLEKYRTLESPKIPLVITGEPASSLTSGNSLTFLTPGGTPLKSFSEHAAIPPWLWHVLPASLALLLLTGGIRRHLASKKIAARPSQELDAEISKVAACAENQITFYREAARVATEWRGGEDFQNLFEKRDELCFHPDAKADPVEKEEENAIIKLLKTLTPLVMFGLLGLLLLTPVHALSADPTEAQNEILSEMKTQPAREHFHNLALCEKALGNVGTAALWGYRFKLHGGDAEALLNDLPGAREKEKEWLDWVTLFPKSTYLQIIYTGVWALALLGLTVILYRGKFRATFITILAILSPSSLVIGIASWFWYPTEISFQPLQTLSVITGKSPMLSQPFDGAKTMRESLEGSLCKVNGTRADWSYFTLPGGLKGWIRESEVTPIHITHDD